jgi:hypothetical protein
MKKILDSQQQQMMDICLVVKRYTDILNDFDNFLRSNITTSFLGTVNLFHTRV